MPPKKSVEAVASTRPVRATRTKRKPETILEDLDVSDKENVEQPAARKPKQQKLIFESETAAKPKTAAKAKAATKPQAKKPTDPSKAAKKDFEEAVKTLEKGIATLDKKAKTVSGNSYALTIEHYCRNAAKQLRLVSKLDSVDSTRAFNLMLALGDGSVADLDAFFRMCGCGGHKDYFADMDDVLLPLIVKKDLPKEKLQELPDVPHRWTRADADVGEFKTGRPNKQQRNQMYSQKLAHEKVRRAERRDRRANTEDWISVTLNELREQRDYMDKYGVYGFFKNSITKLEELEAARV